MNKYSSVDRTWVARNLYDGIIPVIGTDLVIQTTDWKPQLLTPDIVATDFMEVNANFLIKEVGIFSNFADGLVFAELEEGLDLHLRAAGYTHSATVNGTITTAINSRTVTGAGFNSLSSGDIINVGNNTGSGAQHLIMDTITDDNNATVTDFPTRAVAGADWSEWVINGNQQARSLLHIRELNLMHPFEVFFDPVVLAYTTTPEIVLIRVDINSTNLSPDNHDVSFHTDSISSDFESDKVYIDVKAVIEQQE